ncbi:uncharacterized protein METZ01_LOCUS460091, partial [marine metagenome]
VFTRGEMETCRLFHIYNTNCCVYGI